MNTTTSNNKTAIKSLGIVMLYVHDLAKSKTFYTEVVGLPVVPEMSDENFIALAPAQGSLIALENANLLPAGQAKPAGSFEIGFEVEDVDAVYAQWISQGVAIVSGPEDMPFGRTFLAKDPDGHYITVYRLGQQ
jgi:predicted enzyme related to lactoylglutathione lyase